MMCESDRGGHTPLQTDMPFSLVLTPEERQTLQGKAHCPVGPWSFLITLSALSFPVHPRVGGGVRCFYCVIVKIESTKMKTIAH